LGAGSACFDVGESRELKVAAGDWLLLQANHGKEFVNGERVQVREIQNGRIMLGVKCRSAVVRSAVFVPSWGRKSG
jgi:hypothetical protein